MPGQSLSLMGEELCFVPQVSIRTWFSSTVTNIRFSLSPESCAWLSPSYSQSVLELSSPPGQSLSRFLQLIRVSLHPLIGCQSIVRLHPFFFHYASLKLPLVPIYTPGRRDAPRELTVFPKNTLFIKTHKYDGLQKVRKISRLFSEN